MIKRIAVLTSGGDAPGMNAALRAVVRMGIQSGLEVMGVVGGYAGLLQEETMLLTSSCMANILQRGGTVLKTGRCAAFMKPEGRAQAANYLRKMGVQGLVVIGGDGSLAGANLLMKEHGFAVVGMPGTIDNDVYGTDFTIGYDTAMNTAVEAIDRIRDTAASHDRLFIVEVMGRDTGFLALSVGLACGAEEIFFPENPITVNDAIAHIQRGIQRGKKSSILITVEGRKPGRAYDLAESIRKKSGFEAKVCILGHLQRGGAPTAMDRILASRLGASAIKALIEGQQGIMVGIQGSKIVPVPLEEVIQNKKHVQKEWIKLAQILSS